MLDDLERALEAAVEHEEEKLEDGVRLVHRALADMLAREGLARSRPRARSIRTRRRRCFAAVRGARGHRDPGAAEGLPARRPRAAAGAGGRELGPGGRRQDRRSGRVALRGAGRPEERLAGRDQEGVPQARPRGATRTRTRATPRPRRASRRCRARTTCSPIPRSARSTTRTARRTAGPARADERRLRRLRPRRHLRRPVRPRGRRRGRAAAAARPARQRRRGRGADLVRGRAQGPSDDGARRRSSSRATPVTAPVRRREPRRSAARSAAAAAWSRPRRGCSRFSSRARRCRGNGTIVETPCPTCHGSGRERRTKRYTVRIPAGVKDGTKIKLKGKGEAGWGGAPAGDLYVVTRVEPSKLYERRGDDLILEVPVTFDEAALAATVEIPTPEAACR